MIISIGENTGNFLFFHHENLVKAPILKYCGRFQTLNDIAF